MTELNSNITPRAQLEKFAHQIDEARRKQTAQGLPSISLALAYMDWVAHLGASPGYQLLRQYDAWENLSQTLEKNMSLAVNPLQSDLPDSDPRFKHAAWTQWPFHTFKNNFKNFEKWLQPCARIEGMQPHHQHLINFFARQSVDALSPSNTPFTNPEVLNEGLSSLGMTWVKGWQHFIQDQQQLHQKKIHQDSAEIPELPYTVGKDVAITPGKVIFRNSLIELIQYTPTTTDVQAEPLLIVPSCIMKYYILDLSPHNSMVRYLVSQGFSVFMISWRNPDADMREFGLDDYVMQGVIEALSAIRQNTQAAHVHTMGYCLGGTFLAIAAAWLAKEPSPKSTVPAIASVTLLAAQTDFSEPGELGVFIDPDQLKSLREEMMRTGYLSGQQMADAFRFLNVRDLIWSRMIQRYLLGKDEIGNDMMSWNADHTRLPERMHNEYLTQLFLNNALAEGHFRMNNAPVALINIEAPMMVIGTERDHVSPWRSVYKIHLYTHTDITFVLASGGHNAGIVSEPGHPHRHFQLGHTSKDFGWTDPDDWAQSTLRTEGSWWPAWSDWLKQNSSHTVAARVPSETNSLCDAPGEYVMTRYAN